jgi:hypothetical protein
MLASINFAKVRTEFERTSTREKIAAGEDAVEAALKIVAKFVPPRRSPRTISKF